MTSNIGINDLNRQANAFGFAQERSADLLDDNRRRAEFEYDRVKEKVLESLKQTMRPELLNRIDKILVFRPLAMEEIRKIVNLEIGYLIDHIRKQQNIETQVDRDVVKFLADKSFDAAQGARLIRRNIQEMIEDQLAEKIINGEINDKSAVRISLNNDMIDIKQVEKALV
jgi:ATP-dependent Clp protease ATP-binding subunit ClpA